MIKNAPSEQPTLLRALGRWDLAAISLNTIIGSGIFLLPATAASMVGSWAPLCFVVSGAISLLFAFSFAEAGSRFTETGGPYLYAKKAFGNFVGFEVAWIFWASRLAAIGANYSVSMIYLGYFFPDLAEGWIQTLIITCIVIIVAAANIRGVRIGSFFTNSFTIAKLVPLVLLVVGGLLVLNWEKASTPTTISLSDFMRSVLLVAFAFGGFEVATVPAGEAHNPKQHLPQALVISIGAAAFLYVLIQFVAYGLYPDLGASKRPLSDAATSIVGSFGGSLIAVGALISTCGYIFGASLVVPRVTFALAEQGQFHPVFAKIHPTFRTPWVSIILHAIISWFLAVGLSFLSLVIINVLARLVVVGITCGAVIAFQKKHPEQAAIRIPGGVVIPVLGILLVVYLLLQSSANELLWGVGALSVGTLLYIPLKRYLPVRTQAPAE